MYWGDVDTPLRAYREQGAPTRIPATWVAACILYQLQCISSNAHTAHVLSFETGVNGLNGLSFERSQMLPVGSGLYPAMSLMNHSCDPNTTLLYSENGAVLAFMLRAVRRGEQLLFNYGYHFATDPFEDRQAELLDQYYFRCQCSACTSPQTFLTGANGDLLQCSQCKRVSGLVGRPSAAVQHDRGICQCPRATQRQELEKYKQIVVNGARRRVNEIQDVLRALRLNQVEDDLMDHYLRDVVRHLGPDGVANILCRPSMNQDLLQETMKILLEFRFGCTSSHSVDVPP